MVNADLTLFTTRMVERLTGLHERRLERLAKEKVLRPEVVKRGRRRFYLWSWTALLEARVLAALAAAGASGRAIRAAARELRKMEPDRPLSSYTLRVAPGDVVLLEPAGELAFSLVRHRGQGLILALGCLETELKNRLDAGVAEIPRQKVAVKTTAHRRRQKAGDG